MNKFFFWINNNHSILICTFICLVYRFTLSYSEPSWGDVPQKYLGFVFNVRIQWNRMQLYFDRNLWWFSQLGIQTDFLFFGQFLVSCLTFLWQRLYLTHTQQWMLTQSYVWVFLLLYAIWRSPWDDTWYWDNRITDRTGVETRV